MAPRPCTIAVAILLAGAASTTAQRPLPPVPLDSGRLVRFHLDDQTVVRGRLLRPLAPGNAAVVFCRYPAPPCRRPDAPGVSTLAVERIVTLEVQRGTRLWRGFLIGASIGALLVGAGGYVVSGLCDSPGCKTPVPIYAIAGALGGGLWGAIFGSQSVTWEPP